MHKKIKYGIIEFKWVDFKKKSGEIIQRKEIVSKGLTVMNKTEFTMKELRGIFTKDTLKDFFEWKHPKYEPKFLSLEMDKVIDKIRNIKKNDFIKGKEIKTSCGTIMVWTETGSKKETYKDTTITRSGTFYFALLGGSLICVDDKDHEWTKFYLEDKVRQRFNYNDPFKRP